MLLLLDAQDAADTEHTGSIVWNDCKINGFQSKRGGAKTVTCTSCDTAFTGCSSGCQWDRADGPARPDCLTCASPAVTGRAS